MRSLLIKCVFFLFAAGQVFSQNQNEEARAQGLYTGSPFWRQALGGTILSLPHVQAQSAVVALDGGNIKAYSTAGTPMWNYSARGKISPFVTRSREGTSYLSRTNGMLIAVNRSGRELWRRNLGSPLCASVVPGWDGRLFVPIDKKILCYTASGTLLWTKTFESPITVAPKLDSGGGIIFTVGDSEACRLDPFGNIQTWTLSNTPAILLPLEKQRILVLNTDRSMNILGESEDWFFSAQGEVHSSLLPMLPSVPVAAANRGNIIALAFNDGGTALFSIDERKIIWNSDSHVKEVMKNGGKPEHGAEILFDERGIYVLSKNGATCFSHEGKRLWYTILQNTTAIPSFGNDGILYSGGRDWILYAYKIEDRILPEKGDIYGPAPEGSYETGSPKSIYANDFPLNEYEMQNLLDKIKDGIKNGKVEKNEPAWVSLLMMISNSQFHIKYKLNALNYLGQIGSHETIPWLVNFFRRELDPAVRAASVNAIGAIGVDPKGDAIQTFLFLIVNGGGIKDEQVLTAIASATGALCRFSGPPLSETGIKVLSILSAGNQQPVVSRQAKKELASLK